MDFKIQMAVQETFTTVVEDSNFQRAKLILSEGYRFTTGWEYLVTCSNQVFNVEKDEQSIG